MKIFKNFIENTNVKRFFVILFLLFLFILVSAISYSDAVLADISDSVFRLHVIANSDTENDQALKLKVRDELLLYMNTLINDNTTKEDAIKIAEEHKEEFKQIAQRVIKENNFSYPVEVTIGRDNFPTKNYGDISLPSGNYDCLKVKIGEAKGQNWWCVMFPPLCFVDISSGIVPENSKKEIEDNLNSEEYALVSGEDSQNITFKFKLVEFFQNLKLGLK